ncbi:MAG: creatininase family protein [Thermoprotei archaeon]|nr:MAG: creatininase family protein [Thermoprotei archaeon]
MSEHKSYVLSEMTWVMAREYFKKCDVALLPVGSTEQHGPQNPLGTDHLVAYAIAKEVAKRCSVICLPPIPFGVSEHHKHFPGTIFISPSAFREYTMDVIKSLSYHGAKKIVVVNGHGGNLYSLIEVANRCRRDRIAFIVIFQWWESVRDMFPPDEMGHAGAIETSLNLFLHDHLVRMDQVVDEPVPQMRKIGFYFPIDTRDLTSSGVMGKATTASKEKGEKAYTVAVDTLCKLVNRLKEIPFDKLIEHGVKSIKFE